jgi:outer membrane protein OmpA-like peptidoglycan-associated protein/Flp pilus assembly protein TadD
MIKMAKDQQLTINPSPLELHGDSVKVEMSALLPVKMLKKDKVYSLAPWYQYKDQKKPLGEIVFKQKDFPNSKNEQPVLKKAFAFAYTGSEMDRGDLFAMGAASNLNGVTKKTPELNLNVKGLILTNQLVQDVFLPQLASHGYNPGEELEPTTVQFYFEQGSSKLRVTETKGTRGTFLNNFIAAKNPTKTVVITGFHSPEGTELRNTSLSEERAKAIENYYRAEMAKLAKPTAASKPAKSTKGTSEPVVAPSQEPKIDFITKSKVQDWKLFKDSLATYAGLTDIQKSEINSIIDMNKGTFEDAEIALQKLSYYDSLLFVVYPKLRSAETEILTILPKKDIATINSLALAIAQGAENPNKLNDKELGYAATLTPILEEKEAIYKAATKKNDSWESHNNLGSVYLQMAKRVSNPKDKLAFVEKAITHLQISKNKFNSPENNINLAIAYAMKEDKTTSALMLVAAGMVAKNESAKVVRAMNGAVFIKNGSYDPAITALNNSVADAVVTFNRGLAYLLNRNYDAAITSFNESVATDANYAYSYYGLAIAYARKKDEANMARNLGKAVKMDAKLKERAATDLEFLSYFDKDSFKNTVK